MREPGRGQVEQFLVSPLARFRPWVAADGSSPQRDFLRATATHRFRTFRAGNQAQPVDEPILTPTGWRPIGDLKVGDPVMAPLGAVTSVAGVFPHGRRKVYRVSLHGGAWTRCTLDHRWPSSQEPGTFFTLAEIRCQRAFLSDEEFFIDRGGDAPSLRALNNVEQVGEAECVCIHVADPPNLYVTRDRIVTANSGKTTISAVDAVLRLIGKHPFARFKPPIIGWLSALDWDFGVGQVLWPHIREFLPMDEVRNITWLRQGEPSIPKDIVFKCGSQLSFKSSEAGRTKYQGAPLHFVGVDEEHPGDIVQEIEARLLKYGGDFWATLTPLRRERWVLDMERRADCKVVRASTRQAAQAGIVNAAATESFAASLSDRQRAVRIEGDFAQLEGLVYPDWSRHEHILRVVGNVVVNERGTKTVPYPVPESWPRYAAIDFGYANPTAVVVAAAEPATHALIVERVYYSAFVRVTQWAEFLRAKLPKLQLPLVADHDAAACAELQSTGVMTSPAEKDITIGLEAVERYLRPSSEHKGPRLYVILDERLRTELTGRCDGHAFVHEIEGYRYPAQKEGFPDRPDHPIKKDDHAMDSSRYLVQYFERNAMGVTPERVVPVLSRQVYDHDQDEEDRDRSRNEFGPDNPMSSMHR